MRWSFRRAAEHHVFQHVQGVRGGAAVLKEKLRGKKALHIHEYNRAKQAGTQATSGHPHYYHRVFITHPDTGRKTLFVDR